jgi:hypothetical protein
MNENSQETETQIYDGGQVMSDHSMQCYVEVPTPAQMSLRGSLTADFIAGGPLPVNIIHVNQDASVVVTIDFEGSDLARLLCLEWCVSVGFESIGPGEEFNLPPVKQKQAVCNNSKIVITVPVPANRFKLDENSCGGTYIMAVNVLALDNCGKPTPFSGYCTGARIVVHP